MAAFTSIADGNWDDGPTTWGTAAGVYPGSTAGQQDVASIEHFVTLNITTFAGTCNFNIPAAGTLYIAANFNTFGKFTAASLTAFNVYGKILYKNDSAGTYCLAITQNSVLTIKDGGSFEMKSTADPAIKLTLYLSAGTVSNSTYIIAEGGGTIDIQGYATKTQKTFTTVQPLTGATSVTVDDDTGWATGDIVILQYGKSSIVKTLTTGGTKTWNFSGALAADMPEVISVYNMTKNVQLFNNNQARPTRLAAVSGAIVTIKDVSAIATKFEQINTPGTYERICQYTNFGYCFDSRSTSPIKVMDSIFYMWGAGNTGFYLITENSRFENIDIICTGASTIALRNFDGIFVKNFTIVGATAMSCSSSRRIWLHTGRIYDATLGLNSGNSETWVGGNIDFGFDEHGNALPNTTDMTMGYANATFDNCNLSASSVEVSTPSSDGTLIVLTNYDKIEGFRKEFQRYGIIYSDSAEARSGYCLACDPSSTTQPMKFVFSFPCASGKNPQLKFWAKKANTLGTCQIYLSGYSAGIYEITKNSGSVDANGYITPTDDWVQQTINITGDSTIFGEVEVIIEIKDGINGIFYIDDITVGGNI